MDFGTAIKICFSKYFVFDGEAKRSEFWYFQLFVLIAYIVAIIIDINVIASDRYYVGLTEGPLFLIIFLIQFIPSLSSGVRRIHDVGKSGWWILVPIYNIILFCTEGDKKYRPSTTRSYNDEPPTRRSSERSESKFSFRSSRKSGKVDVIDELEELKELYEDGTLSEAQFKKAKQKLLK